LLPQKIKIWARNRKGENDKRLIRGQFGQRRPLVERIGGTGGWTMTERSK